MQSKKLTPKWKRDRVEWVIETSEEQMPRLTRRDILPRPQSLSRPVKQLGAKAAKQANWGAQRCKQAHAKEIWFQFEISSYLLIKTINKDNKRDSFCPKVKQYWLTFTRKPCHSINTWANFTQQFKNTRFYQTKRSHLPKRTTKEVHMSNIGVWQSIIHHLKQNRHCKTLFQHTQTMLYTVMSTGAKSLRT